MRLWALILCRNTAHFAYRHGAIVTVPQQLRKVLTNLAAMSNAQTAQLRYSDMMDL